MNTLLKISAAAVLGAAFAVPALAAYPDRPVTMVIPYGPGGATDISARTISKALGQQAPQPLLMINRTGAGGATGSTSVKNADPDGYTMLFARVGSHSVNPAMKATLPYKIEDFRFVGVYEINPVVCATAMNSGIDSMAALMKKAKSGRGAVSFSSSGVGSLLHLAAVMVLDSFGLEDAANNATHIPLKGGGAAATAVLNGTATVVCTNSSALAGFVKNKQLRPLMVTTPKRLDGFEAPTAAELGKPELEQLVGWTGIAGPKGISDEVANIWRGWLKAATSDQDFVAKMTVRGSVIRLMDPDESWAFINKQYATFRKLVDQLGLRIKN